jgi:DNA-binding GntR family transcriptional regulator
MAVGEHLTEVSLQRVLGTSSRGPIRAALGHLADRGVVEKIPNKGFFLAHLPSNGGGAQSEVSEAGDERVYLAIASDRLSRGLPETITENELMRRYDLPRHRLRRILERIATEGWMERRAGHGWSFLPMIDSPRAYRESFELRRILEPAGILSPDFKLDRTMLDGMRTRQEFVAREGHRSLSQIELFETNSHFHETIAAMSGNRFLAQTIARQNQLRRLIEYRQFFDRDRVLRQSKEHLAILDLLDSGDQQAAADLMRRHIGGAAREKTKASAFRSEQPKTIPTSERMVEIQGK